MLLSVKKAYLEQVDSHVPLTAVTNGVFREEVDQAIIDGQICILDRKLEVIIRLVQLVPEEEV
jgi:hypothetical protein